MKILKKDSENLENFVGITNKNLVRLKILCKRYVVKPQCKDTYIQAVCINFKNKEITFLLIEKETYNKNRAKGQKFFISPSQFFNATIFNISRDYYKYVFKGPVQINFNTDVNAYKNKLTKELKDENINTIVENLYKVNKLIFKEETKNFSDKRVKSN